MVKSCKEIINLIENKYPLMLAEDYDNVGLLIGDDNMVIKKILVCLDINQAVVDEAIRNDVDMILSHHPLIFSPIKRILSRDPLSNLIIKIIRADICVYALHTNFDNADNGMNDILAESLELININKLGKGTGRYGILNNSTLFNEFCDFVKRKLNINSLKVSGDLNSMIRTIAVVGGAGSDFINDALALNCDVIITGDVKHHSALDGLNSGINIIDAGHFSTEIIALPYIAKLLTTITGIETLITRVNTNPFQMV